MIDKIECFRCLSLNATFRLFDALGADKRRLYLCTECANALNLLGGADLYALLEDVSSKLSRYHVYRVYMFPRRDAAGASSPPSLNVVLNDSDEQCYRCALAVQDITSRTILNTNISSQAEFVRQVLNTAAHINSLCDETADVDSMERWGVTSMFTLPFFSKSELCDVLGISKSAGAVVFEKWEAEIASSLRDALVRFDEQIQRTTESPEE